jgi:hypothetical protein
MAQVVKTFNKEKGLPYWYVEFDGDRYGPFSTSEEAHDFLDNDENDNSNKLMAKS